MSENIIASCEDISIIEENILVMGENTMLSSENVFSIRKMFSMWVKTFSVLGGETF